MHRTLSLSSSLKDAGAEQAKLPCCSNISTLSMLHVPFFLTVCRDNGGSHCKMWKQSNLCKDEPAMMELNCPKTCKLC